MYKKFAFLVKKIYSNIISFAKKSKEDSLSAYAAQTTFFIILSFVPLVILVFLISSNIPNLWTNILSYVLNAIPEHMHKYVYYVVDDIMNSGNKSFTIMTVLLALWSSAKSVQALCYGLDRIYGVKREKNYIMTRLISIIYVFILVVLCIVAMVIDIFASHIINAIIKHSHFMVDTTILLLSLRTLFIFFILFVLILLMYYQLPARKGRFRDEIYGAGAAAAALILMTRLFSFYIKYISNMSYMYGGLTSIIVIIIWVYFCVQIVLYGAQVNYYLKRS